MKRQGPGEREPQTPVDRGGRIDPVEQHRGEPFDADDRVDEAIAESFPASDPPSYNGGLDKDR